MSSPVIVTPTERNSYPAYFATTHWTKVLEARGATDEARQALAELCETYYTPVLRFIRRERETDDAARELTQEFFARLLARRGLDTVEPGRGRFRSFLLGAVKHFLADMRDRDRAAKRDCGRPLEAIQPEHETSLGIQPADPQAFVPDTLFDREWAFAILEHALTSLAEEHRAAGQSEQFEALKPWLTGDTEKLPQAIVAARLGWNEGAMKVAVHRLRRRFRESVKSQIRQTVAEPAQIDEELRYLVEVLAQS